MHASAQPSPPAHVTPLVASQADLQDPNSNFVQPSRVRSGRVLGRCHAALGQRELSSAALEAALEQARAHRLRWSESLAAREMGLQQPQS